MPFLEGPMGLIIEGRNGLGVPPGSSQGSQMPLRVPGTHHTLMRGEGSVHPETQQASSP